MRKKLFSWYTLALSVVGLALNVVLVMLTNTLNLPLYLDSIGTVITAALGGPLPGIAVGFFSNCITAFTSVSHDPMTMYYSILNVMIAVVAAWFSQKGLFLKWRGKILAVLSFAFIGGALGSCITWLLYGFSFGQGVSAPFAKFLFEKIQINEFAAQFMADMTIDLCDKLLTVAVLCLVLYLLPRTLLNRFPLGFIYADKAQTAGQRRQTIGYVSKTKTFRKRSITKKITAFVLVSATVLGVSAVVIGSVTYNNKLVARNADECETIVDMMLAKIDGDSVDRFIEQGENNEQYVKTEKDLYDIFLNTPKIEYMYVYKIETDGCHVVFDLDTEDLSGEQPGTLIEFDSTFPYTQQLLEGQEIPYVITDETYGWLLTVYKPIKNSVGNVVAYAAADIDMQSIRTDLYTFLINIASLLFGVMIIIAVISMLYLDKHLIEPMDVLAEQARDFDFDGKQKNSRVRNRKSVKTGDELEEVFSAMCRTEDAIAEHIEQLNSKNLEISLMQRNIIFTLANMVENRDSNTGGHIKRTASYVRLTGLNLKAAGKLPEIVNDEYIKQLYNSAPLHDIGKVKIPDAVLNKPGRLTTEEFELMKTHTTEGGRILRSSLSDIEDSSWLSMAIDMATYHHEKWNGTGYPEGLKGESIPLCARIMAIADVFDALVSERSYKKAFDYETAKQIILNDSGSHFDPMVVEAFFADEESLKKIMMEKI